MSGGELSSDRRSLRNHQSMSAKQSIKRMLVTVLFGRGLMAARQLIAVPLLLGVWGSEYLGAWLLLSTVPALLSVSNGGLGTSGNLQIAHSLAKDDKPAAERVFASTQVLIAAIFAVVLIICCCGLLLYSNRRPAMLEFPIGTAALLLGAVCINTLSLPLMGWWTGAGLAFVGYRFQNALGLLTLAVTLAVPYCGGRAFATAFSQFLVSFLWLTTFYIRTHSKFGLTRRSYIPTIASLRAEGPSLMSKGIGHQVGQLWQALLFQGTLMLAGLIGGASAAALWGAMRVFARAGNQFVEVVCQAVSPEMQVAVAVGRTEKLRQLHASTITLCVCAAAGLSTILIFFGPQLFSVWTKGALTLPKDVWTIMVVSLLPFSVWSASAEIQRAANRPWELNLSALSAVLVSAALTALMGWRDLLSVATGLLIFECCMIFLVFPKSLSIMSCRYQDAFSDLFHALQRRRSQS